MPIQPSMLMVPLLATILMSTFVQAVWEPSSDAKRLRLLDRGAQILLNSRHRQAIDSRL